MLDGSCPDRSFSFFLLPSFSLQAFSSAVEVLQLANEAIGRTAYRWNVISRDGKPVSSSCRMVVGVDDVLTRERERTRTSSAATVVVVCGGWSDPPSDKSLEAWLRECRRSRIDLVGIGSGTIVLARAGLAEGRRCAIHWEQFPVFCEKYPGVEAVQTAFEHDGDLSTCPGGVAPFDLFFRLVERDHGATVADQISEKTIARRIRTAGDPQRLLRHSQVRLNHDAVLKVADQMAANLSEPIQVDVLVASTGLSRRQVERLFAHELGCSPSRYYLKLRLERAHLLLVSSRLPVVEVAIACGFVSASHFSKVYRKVYGFSPNQNRMAVSDQQDHPAGFTRSEGASPTRPRHTAHHHRHGSVADTVSGHPFG